MRTPKQARSRRTLDAILDAAERLLADRPFGEIAVQEIILAAGCSTGSFYARFAGKDDLIAPLYARFDAAHAERIEAIDAAQDWSRTSLSAALERIVDEHIRAYAVRPHLMREFALYVRRAGASLPAEGVARRSRLFARAVEGLTAARTQSGRRVSPDAAAFALTVIGNMVREAVVFDDNPLSEPARLAHDALKARLLALLTPYLETSGGR